MKHADGGNNSSNEALILKPNQKTLLVHSIANYLQRSGFPRTLKKFLSEAKIQKDDLEDSSFDLEEMLCNFLDIRNNVRKNFKSHKVQELQNDIIPRRDGKGDFAAAAGTFGDGKKKKSDKSSGDKFYSKNDVEVTAHSLVPTDVKSKEKKRNKKNSCSLGQEEVGIKVLNEPADDIIHNSSSNKCKNKKKKCDLDSEALIGNTGYHPLESLVGATEENNKNIVFLEGKNVTDSETDNKLKDKKKKNKMSSGPVVHEGKTNKIDSNKVDCKTPKEKLTDKDNKNSKKRKRLASEEDVVQPTGKKLVEESKHGQTDERKRRKTEGSEESRIIKQSAVLNSASKTEENALKEESSSQKIKQIDGQSNASFDEHGKKCTMNKQQNGSAEPKTVKRFQRVNIDDVVFSDDRLKDNSYWAKGGAENGYGAKAQEVLGQVRGRDFRHEKTKKKRGSYRGGQIDLQSHSIKFNYSDDD